MRTTVICHVYNEAYLLPWWLEHHARQFDHGIIIDYASTDGCTDMVAQICPTWEVRQSRNEWFGAVEVDLEVMDVERGITGIKMVLNVTEFLVTRAPLTLASFFNSKGQAFQVPMRMALSNAEVQEPQSLAELFDGITLIMRSVYGEASYRIAHSMIHGHYHVGRHSIDAHSEALHDRDCMVVRFTYYPWNELFLKRKLQIGARMSPSDRITRTGGHHLWNVDEMTADKEKQLRHGEVLDLDNLRSMVHSHET
jgi:hypothetical protein